MDFSAPPATHLGAALYVHWPWCKTMCPYCDFNSHAADESNFDTYTDCLIAELQALPWQMLDKPLISIFFGGGTPSLMGAERIAKILNIINKTGNIGPDTEITVECNPTSSSAELMQGLKAAGVNRVSLGVQGLSMHSLTFLGRTHSVAHAQHTLDDAQKWIGNVNADVIYGLPEQNLTEWETLLQGLATRKLPHISAYQLTVEKNTKFYSDVKRGLWQPMDNDGQADFFETTATVLGGAGYENYEISNFATPTKPCAHNLHVWRYGTYWGVGAGAHGRHQNTSGQFFSTQNPKHPRDYMALVGKRVNEGFDADFLKKTPIYGCLALAEALMMGLRLAEGVNTANLKKQLLTPFWHEAVLVDGLTLMARLGFVEQSEHRIKLTPAGWPLLDTVLKEILRPL